MFFSVKEFSWKKIVLLLFCDCFVVLLLFCYYFVIILLFLLLITPNNNKKKTLFPINQNNNNNTNTNTNMNKDKEDCFTTTEPPFLENLQTTIDNKGGLIFPTLLLIPLALFITYFVTSFLVWLVNPVVRKFMKVFFFFFFFFFFFSFLLFFSSFLLFFFSSSLLSFSLFLSLTLFSYLSFLSVPKKVDNAAIQKQTERALTTYDPNGDEDPTFVVFVVVIGC